jgi:nucleotide-binding universal stress UspA family protein
MRLELREEAAMAEILVGFDGTPGADDALAFAAGMARAAGASIRLVYAYPYDDTRTRASNETYREYLHEDADAVLAATAESVRDLATVLEPIADVSPARALHGAALRGGAALIVVGSTHRGRIGRVLPGSTGERLLHGAPCAVAIVPRGYAEHCEGITSIAVGYDASDESAVALRAACRLAGRFGATLRVVHVFDASQVGRPALMTGPAWSTMRDEHEAARREELEEAVATVPQALDAEMRFLVGRPGRELADQSEAVDIMVVGARGYGPLAAVLLGGVSHALIARAACPVIVLPRGVRGGLDPLFESSVDATA